MSPAGALRIVEESVAVLSADYGAVPTSFSVEKTLELSAIDGGLGGLALTEVPVARPYVKDYGADPANRPAAWPGVWDVSRWGVIAAFDGGARVGGAVVAWDTPELFFLDGRRDVAAVWDLRVAPSHRHRGIGARLFGEAVAWARGRACRILKIETQNNNVVACRFYRAQGCHLAGIARHAYPALPAEVQLVWCLELCAPPPSRHGAA